MAHRFHSFAQTSLGRDIAKAIDSAGRYAELVAFSREGFPAVTAVVSLVSPLLLPLRNQSAQFNSAKQFVGWYVGEIMRAHGHSIRNKSVRVPGRLFTVGALWTAAPA